VAFTFEVSLLDHIGVGVVVVDPNGRILAWNAFMTKHSGVFGHDVVDQNLSDSPLVSDSSRLRAYLDQVIANKSALNLSWEQVQGLFKLCTESEGGESPGEMMHSLSFSPVLNFYNEVEAVCLTITNSTDSQLYQALLQDALCQVEEMARFDSVTGLYDRQYLIERTLDEFNRGKRYDTFFSLLIIDLDDFKLLNEVHGYLSGDEVLRAFAQRLRGGLRNVDLAGRYGGEQFIVLLPSTDEKSAMVAAERIRKVSEDYVISTHTGDVTVTCSIGVAMFSDKDSDLRSLLQRAEKAMLTVKASGKNNVECASFNEKGLE